MTERTIRAVRCRLISRIGQREVCPIVQCEGNRRLVAPIPAAVQPEGNGRNGCRIPTIGFSIVGGLVQRDDKLCLKLLRSGNFKEIGILPVKAHVEQNQVAGFKFSA